jgi:hypothetical protein
VTLAETGLAVGVVLALAGIVRILANEGVDDGQQRFAVYLVALLLSLTLVGYLLLTNV